MASILVDAVARFHRSGGFQPGNLWRLRTSSSLFENANLAILSTKKGLATTSESHHLSALVAVLDPDFREAIPQRITRQSEQARRLRLVAVRSLESFANHFVLPLVESHTVG